MKKDDFWIPVSFGNPEITVDRLEKALAALQQAHNWSIQYLNGYWLDNLATPAYVDFRHDFRKYVYREKLLRHTQNYSLNRMSEKSVSYFLSKIALDDENKAVLVDADEIDSIQIKSRRIWRKYLIKGYGLTTHYGNIFPEAKWKEIIREQMDGTPIDLIPFLWHSVVVKQEGDWSIRFNFHKQDSKAGEKAKKELEETFKD